MKKLFLGGALLLGAIAPATAVSASTMSASAGYAYDPSDEACFKRDWGKLTTDCFDAKRYWDIPVENPSFVGNKTFKAFGASAVGDAAGNLATACAAIVLGNNGGEPSINKWTLFQVLNSSQANWTTLGTLPIAAEETVLYECAVSGVGLGSGPPGFVGQVIGF